MSRCCKCNSRLLCMCLLPCMMTGHLLVYVLVSVLVTISYAPPKSSPLYVAPGASANSSRRAPRPLGPFWKLRLEEGALWNRLQHAWDRRHNPLLWANASRAPGSRVLWEAEEPGCASDCPSRECWRPRGGGGLEGLPEQLRAFVGSMHCREYRLLMDQPGLCQPAGGGGGGEEPAPLVLLMAVKSQVGNFENRQAIRETWGRSGAVRGQSNPRAGGQVRTVFLLGRQDAGTGPHPNLSNLLELENRKYGDILLWDFRDSFFNLTLKDLLLWRWLRRRCAAARFVFKGDDDVFVRTGPLLDFLQDKWEEHQRRRGADGGGGGGLDLFVGDVITDAQPYRQPSAKYYIPEGFYQGGYPPYAGGGGVVYSASLAARLAEVSERVRLFPIDDVYLGMCLRRLGLAPSHHPGFLTFDLPSPAERADPCAYGSVLLVHRRSPAEMLTLWEQLKRRC